MIFLKRLRDLLSGFNLVLCPYASFWIRAPVRLGPLTLGSEMKISLLEYIQMMDTDSKANEICGLN